ncbi:MAG: carboxypeptidase-like regulatory domain-containing protein [Candidatus Nitrosotenuis sp.]
MQYAIISLILAVILVFGVTPAFAAKPWDLIIKTQFEQDQIEVNEKPVIFGNIVNHLDQPVSGVQLKIRFADNSVITTTDEDGNFRYEFGEQQSQGVFSVSISATLYDLKGFATATLKIGKDVSTFDDIYYSKGYDKDIKSKNDPYKALKQKQYQKFIEEQNKRKQKQYEIEAQRLALQDKRDVASQKRNETINATAVGAGIYSTDDQGKYISRLDPRIKDVIRAQLDYTRQIYEEAKYEMQKVLENGGSLADAKKAYFDKIASTNDQIQKVGSANNTENHSKIKKHEDLKINSKKVKGLTYNKNLK